MGTPFGEWITDARTGTAHYVLDGKCLCGARIGKPVGPPRRKPVPSQAGKEYGVYATPICGECRGLNEARWLGKKGVTFVRPRPGNWRHGAKPTRG